MLIEYGTYIATFIITTGLAVIGILVCYQLHQTFKKPVLQILLYQQIFLFSFFIYGIWGNLAIREIIADLNLSAELHNKLALFLPVLGIPFLIVSWFMLLRFGYNLNGYKIHKKLAYSYFPLFLALIFVLTWFIQNQYIQIPEKTDLFIVRTILVLNLIVHLMLFFPFLKPKKSTLLTKEIGFGKKSWLLYFSGVVLYTALLTFFNVFGFISTCISIVALFGTTVFIPVFIKSNIQSKAIGIRNTNIDFRGFCGLYEITKREAEIVLEICSGKTNKAIAEKLFITLQTVKDHNHRIFTKIDVKSRVQLANLVREKTGIKEF